jgi:hypothetical protein
MMKLEKWAARALCAIIAGPQSTKVLAELTSKNWDTATLLAFRAYTKDTEADKPALTFIQYLISTSTKEIVSKADHIDEPPCAGFYHNLKESNTDPALFGCVFLNVLSLGHRSSVWSTYLTRDDRAILYAAQAQLIDVSEELKIDLGWLSGPDPTISRGLCGGCGVKIKTSWARSLRQCSNALGSGLPLKDVSILAQIAINRYGLEILTTQKSPYDCPKFEIVANNLRHSFRGPEWTRTPCPMDPMLDLIDTHIQQVYTEVASFYKRLTK